MVDADIAVMGLMQTMLHAKKLEPKQLHVVIIMLMVTIMGMMGLMQPVPVSNVRWQMPVVCPSSKQGQLPAGPTPQYLQAAMQVVRS